MTPFDRLHCPHLRRSVASQLTQTISLNLYEIEINTGFIKHCQLDIYQPSFVQAKCMTHARATAIKKKKRIGLSSLIL